MAIKIHKGCDSLTGRWLPTTWQIHLPGGPAQKFKLLADAKRAAVEAGASGRWVRSVEPLGPRQAKVTVYTDAAPEKKEKR